MQPRGVVLLGKRGFLLAGDVVVNQGSQNASQVQSLAHQLRAHPGPRPMKPALVAGQLSKAALIGLDFFQVCQLQVLAIGPAPHAQVPISTTYQHFS